MFQFPVLVVYLLLCFYFCSGNYAAVASFSDDRCDADGVCPSDPLTFTCELNGIAILQVVLPNGEVEFVSPGISQDKLNEELPDGFTAEDLVITPIDNASRNYVLTLSIASASLLDGGVITCDGATGSSANAGCPILASPTPSNLRQLPSSNTPTTATITWDSVDNAVSYNVSTSLRSRETRIEEESYTLTGLELETDYTVSVTATNECGVQSSPSQDVTVRIDIQAPVAPVLGDPLIDCSDNDETMALVEISWTYGESRPTSANGFVDAPLNGVKVSYRDNDGSSKNACVDISDTICTCGSVSVADTSSCSLYLPLRDGLQYEGDDDVPVTVVVQISNGKTTESEIMLDARPMLVDEGLDESDEFLSVTLMVNPLCHEDKYPVLVTFGAQENDNGTCQGQRNATLISLAAGESATFSVDRDTVTPRENEEYCYTVSINGRAGGVMMMSDDEESESAGPSTGAAVGITLAITLLVSLPVGVALGCCGMWWYMMRRGATSGQKVTQLQAAIYEEPATPAMEPATIPLTDNQAYGHVKACTRS